MSPSWRVSLLTPAYWPEVERGGERIVADLAQGMAARGHSVRILSSHPGRPTSRVEDGVLVVRSWRPPDRWLRSRELEDYLTHVPFSYLGLRRGGDDLAHAIFATDALAASKWARRTGRPAVFTFTGIPDRTGFLQRRGRLEITRRAVRESSAFTVLSEAAARASRRWLGVEPRVIPPSVDLETFRPGGGRASDPTIFCPAAIEDPRKGLRPLLRALRLIRREHPRARLLLPVRGGADLAARLRTEEGVELVETGPRGSELPSLYRHAWVTALPSIGEAFGLVLIESLACGTPVVGSPHGGIPEIIDRPEIGRVSRSLAPVDLARAMKEAFELGDRPDTVECCRARAEHFSPARAIAAYEGLYSELLESRQ